MKKKLLTLIIISLLFFSCGALHKKQSLQQSLKTTESLSLENQDSHISSETSQWLQSWIEQLHYSNTLIHSDSTITYQPNSGFQLSKGTIILSELRQQTASNQETLSSKEQENSHSHQQQEFSAHQEEIIKQHEKERSPPISLIWLIIISLIALLSPLVLTYKHQRKNAPERKSFRI